MGEQGGEGGSSLRAGAGGGEHRAYRRWCCIGWGGRQGGNGLKLLAVVVVCLVGSWAWTYRWRRVWGALLVGLEVAWAPLGHVSWMLG